MQNWNEPVYYDREYSYYLQVFLEQCKYKY